MKRSASIGVLVGLMAAGFAGAACAQSVSTVVDSDVSAWGVPNTATYGQLVLAPTGATSLTDFTFHLEGAPAINYQAYVYQWDTVNLVTTGSALYQSGVLTSPTGAGDNPVTITTSGTNVVAGQVYVMFFTTSGVTQSVPPSTDSWLLGTGGQAGYDFVYNNNSTNFSRLATDQWTDWGSPLYFNADFTGQTIDTSQPYFLASNLDTTFAPVFQGGTLRIDVANFASADNFTLDGSGTNTIDTHGNTTTLSGVISNAVPGTPGALIVTDGVGGGPLILTGANTYTGGTTVNAGTVLQLGAGGVSGSVVGNIADNGALLFDHSNTVTFGGVISGSGLLGQIGSGATILNGVNTVTGGTAVFAGELEVGDAAHPGAVLDSHIGGVVVSAGGTLSGHGTINGAVTNLAGGVVAPGGTIGTLTVGAYTANAGSTLAIETSPSAASKLAVVGAASLNGTAAVSFDPGAYGQHSYQILTANSISGAFATYAPTGLPAGFVSGLYYAPSGKEVNLVILPKTAAQVFGDLSTESLDAAGALSGAVTAHVSDCGDDWNKAYKTCARNGVWMQPFGRAGWTAATGQASAFKANSAGFIGGIDGQFGPATLGLAAAYDHETANINNEPTSAASESWFASAYGRTRLNGFVFDGQAFYMSDAWRVHRDTSGSGVALSSPNANVAGGSVQIALPLSDGAITPRARLGYANVSRTGVTETGVGGLALTSASASNDSFEGSLGMVISGQMNGTTSHTTFQLTTDVIQQFASLNRASAASLAHVSGTGFTAQSAAANRTTLAVGAEVRTHVTDRADLFVGVDGDVGANQQAGTISLGGHIRF
jgi:autotransporter-associated beta strand protein